MDISDGHTPGQSWFGRQAPAPVPRVARGISWTVGSMVLLCFVAMSVIKIDRVVTAQGRVIARAPTIVVQPLETAIVRSIEVTEGDVYKRQGR